MCIYYIVKKKTRKNDVAKNDVAKNDVAKNDVAKNENTEYVLKKKSKYRK